MVACRYFPFIGGLETHVYEVVHRLAGSGIEITLLTTIPHNLSTPLPKEEIVDGVRILRVMAWPAKRDYCITPELYSIVKNGTWDIIHCQGYHTLVPPVAMLAAQKANIPYVLSFHTGGDSSQLRKMFRGVQRMALRPLLAHAERLISPSKWEVDFFQERLHLPATKFVVIPNGSHHLSNSAGPEQEEKNSPLIVSVGRLERYKGHHRILAAMPKVIEQIPDARLRIVGIGPYESTLHSMVKKLGLAKHVEIQGIPPGDGEGMVAVIARANLVTLLSEHEAQGIVVLEALAQRRPVLVAATSALQEFAERGLARSVPLTSSPEVVAQAVVTQLREPLIPTGVTLPTWDDCTSKLVTLYTSIIRGSECAS
ncbi:MAG: glycosyltransferase family 4 protein [Ktedonobacteraceae bacterium]